MLYHKYFKAWTMWYRSGTIRAWKTVFEIAKDIYDICSYIALSHYWFDFFYNFFCVLLCCYGYLLYLWKKNPANIYLFKFTNIITRKRSETFSKLIIKMSKPRHWLFSSVFIVNFKYISHLSLVFLLLTLTKVNVKC